MKQAEYKMVCLRAVGDRTSLGVLGKYAGDPLAYARLIAEGRGREWYDPETVMVLEQERYHKVGRRWTTETMELGRWKWGELFECQAGSEN